MEANHFLLSLQCPLATLSFPRLSLHQASSPPALGYSNGDPSQHSGFPCCLVCGLMLVGMPPGRLHPDRTPEMSTDTLLPYLFHMPLPPQAKKSCHPLALTRVFGFLLEPLFYCCFLCITSQLCPLPLCLFLREGLTLQARLTLKLGCSCFNPGAGRAVSCHHTRPLGYFITLPISRM